MNDAGDADGLVTFSEVNRHACQKQTCFQHLCTHRNKKACTPSYCMPSSQLNSRSCQDCWRTLRFRKRVCHSRLGFRESLDDT